MLQAQRSICLLHKLHSIRFFSSAGFPSLLHLCKKPVYLFQVHARLLLLGVCDNPTLVSQLIETYANFRLVRSSKRVLYSLARRNSFHYNALLRSMGRLRDFDGLLSAYREMILESISPDDETVHLVALACNQRDDRIKRQIQGNITKLGLNADSSTGETNGSTRMEKVFPELFTLDCLLKCSIHERSLTMGRTIHCAVIVDGFNELDNAIISMYSKLGSLRDVEMMFERMPVRDIVAWNILICSYCDRGYPVKSMNLVKEMISSGIHANVSTILHAFSSIRKLKSVFWAKEFHSFSVKNGLDVEPCVHNVLINVYFSCGCVNYAERCFNIVMNKDLITFSTMIKGYVQFDRSQDALFLFHMIRLEGYEVDDVLILNLLPVSVKIGGSEIVTFFHCYVVKLGLNLLLPVITTLLVSYAKCGLIDMARKLFEESNFDRDLVVWNSMICAYAKHGDWFQCSKLHDELKQANLIPDEVTFLGLLTACVNSGFVEQGLKVFKEMTKIYNYQPTQEHFACMVDLLGRAGHLKEACEVTKLMPFDPKAQVWSSILNSSKEKDLRLVESAGEKLMDMEEKNAGNYILLSNIYAAAGKWDLVAKTRSFLKDKRITKTPGISSIEMNGKLHEFVSGGSHSRADEIYKILRSMEMKSKVSSWFLEVSVMSYP